MEQQIEAFVVVDASVAFKWLIVEEDTEKAISLLQAWENDGIRLAAPYFMLAEITNALHRHVRRGELTIRAALDLLDYLLTLDIELHETPHLHHRALELASQLNQGAAYDSHYLALAETLDCELWTADQRLHRTAGTLAPKIHWLGELVS